MMCCLHQTIQAAELQVSSSSASVKRRLFFAGTACIRACTHHITSNNLMESDPKTAATYNKKWTRGNSLSAVRVASEHAHHYLWCAGLGFEGSASCTATQLSQQTIHAAWLHLRLL